MKQHSPAGRHRGFTLVEVLSVVAVIAILAAIALGAYGMYMDRARSVEIIGKYDAIRTGSALAARTGTGPVADCTELARALDNANLADRHATLSYAFEATTGGWRPVLSVCALAAQHGKEGVHTARQTYEVLSKNGVAEPNPVLTDSVVSFALRLTQGDRALCQVHRPATAPACASTGAVATTQAPVTQAPVTQPPVTQPPATQVAVTQPPVSQPGASQAGISQPATTQPATTQPAASQAVPPALTVLPAGQGASQVAGVTSPPGQPPTVLTPGTTANPRPPGQGTTAAGGQRPPQAGGAAGTAQGAGGGPLDVTTLAAGLMGHHELGFLNQRDQEVVTATVAMMAMNPSYALVVKTAIGSTPPRQAVNVPSSPQNRYTIRFSGEMHRALEVLYPEAARRACLANRPAGTNCG